MTKQQIVDTLLPGAFFVAVVAIGILATKAENKRTKQECIALFAAATTAHDSLIVLVDVPNCRTLLQAK